jgi:predicted ATP-dependent serine protease
MSKQREADQLESRILLAEDAVAAFESYRRNAANTVIPFTRFPRLGEALGGGLWPGEVTALLGPPGSGKTQLALEFSLGAMVSQIPVLYVAPAATPAEIVGRLVALKTESSHWPAVVRAKTEDVDQKILAAADAVRSSPFGIWPPEIQGMDILDGLASDVERLRTRFDPKRERSALVVIDSLQHLGRGADWSQPPEVRRSRAMAAAGSIASAVGVAVVVVSQAVPAKCTWGEGHQFEADAHGAEFDAANVLVLELAHQGARIGIAKQRLARRTWMSLEFTGTRFTERA